MTETTSSSRTKIVLSLDVGTSTVKAILISKDGVILGRSHEKNELSYPEPDCEEIDHNRLWKLVKNVIKGCVEDANISPLDISCVGLCTFRGSFITWSKKTGVPFHNIITWKDRRAEQMARDWDNGPLLQLQRLISGPAYLITGNKWHQLNKNYHLDTALCNIKMSWILKNNPEVIKAHKDNDLMFGTLDTWLTYKLNGGQHHVTEPSNAISTGFWEMFQQDYSAQHLTYFGIPRSILPKVVTSQSSTKFGYIDQTIFEDPDLSNANDFKLPITAVLADQGASAFGLNCVNKGDMKATLGTGAFFDINTGDSPHCTFDGLWPIIGWETNSGLSHFAEGKIHATNTCIEWAENMGLFEDPGDSSDIAYSAKETTDSLCFVPAFYGLHEPFLDNKAGCGFIGLSPEHGRKEMVRAVLESISFSVKAIVERAEEQIDYAKLTKEIRCDGGISNNDFVMQLIADLTDKSVIRMPSPDMSAVGVALMAGMEHGIWKNRDDIGSLLKPKTIFKPNNSREQRQKKIDNYERWKRACLHFADFNEK